MTGAFGMTLLQACGVWPVGYALAVIPGLILGLWSGRSATLARLLGSSINGIKSVPGISWLPLALIWLGVGFMTTVSLIALAGFFPVYFSAAAAAASVPPNLINAGRMLGLSRQKLFVSVILPWAMPQICAGLRVALGMSFAYLVLGELPGVPDGLGALIMDARHEWAGRSAVKWHCTDCLAGECL